MLVGWGKRAAEGFTSIRERIFLLGGSPLRTSRITDELRSSAQTRACPERSRRDVWAYVFYVRGIETARCRHLSSSGLPRSLRRNSRPGSWRSSRYGFVRPHFHHGPGRDPSCKAVAVDTRGRNFCSFGASWCLFIIQAPTGALTNLRIYSGLCHRDRRRLRRICGKKRIARTFREVVFLWG